MAKVNTNIMNDIAESLKDSTKNLPKEEKEKVENEVLQEVQQKIENQQKQINEATSKTSEELNNYANKVEETENSIASSASKLESANEIPKITSTIDLNARNEKIAIKREERKNNSTSSNTSKTSDTKVTEKSTTSSNTNTKTTETSKKTNDTKVVETNEIVDKSSTNNIKNTNITAKEKFKEQQLEEKNSKSNTNTTISQNLKNVEKRIDDIDTKNSNNINNSKTLTNSEISNRLGYIPGTELAIQEYSKATSKKIKEAKSVSNTSSSTDEVPQQKSVREYLQAGPQWLESSDNNHNIGVGIVADVGVAAVGVTEGVASFGQDILKCLSLAGGGLVTAVDGCVSLVGSIWNEDALSEFKDRNNQRWEDVGTFVSTDYVSMFYDDIYEITGLKDNALGFDKVRNVSKGVGYLGAAVVTGGAIGGLAGAAAGTTKAALINGAVYGLARFGGSTGDAVQNGASMEEALLYGGLTGAKEGIGMFVGSAINAVTPIKGALPMTKGAWVNSATHVALDTFDGAVSATADPLIQTIVQSIYTPSEEKLKEMGYKGTVESYENLSFGEKYKVNFEANGGVNNVVGTALFSGVMSAGSEVIGQLKANSSVKKGQKLYNEVVENNTEINNIKGQSMLNDNNGLAYNTLDDLYAQRDSLKQAYDKLDDYGKYAFELSLTKDAINSGKIASADIDILLNSGKLKSLYQNLSNQERLALFDAMDETQMRSYFGQLGEKESKSFVNKNSSYISNRFFNTDSNSTSSTWSNSSSLALSSSSSLALGAGVNTKNSSSLMVAYPTQLLPTTKEIGNSNSKIGFQFFAKPSKANNSELERTNTSNSITSVSKYAVGMPSALEEINKIVSLPQIDNKALSDVNAIKRGSNPFGKSYGEIDKFFMASGTEYGNNQHGLTNEIKDSSSTGTAIKLFNPEYEFDKETLKEAYIENELKNNKWRKRNGEAELTLAQIESRADAIVDRNLQVLSNNGSLWYSEIPLFMEYFKKKNSGDLNKAYDQLFSTFDQYDVKYLEDDTEGKRLCDLLIDKGMPEYEARQYMEQIDSTGICTYSTCVNQILAAFRGNPEGFKERFGFDMYIDTENGRQLNSNELMMDFHTWINSHYINASGGNTQSLLKIDNDGNLRLNKFDTKHQIFMNGKSGTLCFGAYLDTKGLQLKYSNFQDEIPFCAGQNGSDDTFTSFVKQEMEKGNLLSLIIDSPKLINEQIKDFKSLGSKAVFDKNTYKFIDIATGKVICDTSRWKKGGHSMFITGTTDEGVIVATWGHRALIREEDFQGNVCHFQRINIESWDQ